MPVKSLSSPLHVGTANGSPLRFFRSPEAEVDTPWFVLDDLDKCLALGEEARELMLRAVRADWGRALRSVATRDGIVVLAPHFIGKGLVEAMAQAGMDIGTTPRDFYRESVASMKVLTSGLSGPDKLAFSLAALATDGSREEV